MELVYCDYDFLRVNLQFPASGVEGCWLYFQDVHPAPCDNDHFYNLQNRALCSKAKIIQNNVQTKDGKEQVFVMKIARGIFLVEI